MVLLDKLEGVRFSGFGKEVGASGTPHLQGIVCFAERKRFKAVCALLPGFHIEVMKGTAEQAWDYCKKQDPDPWCTGELPTTKRTNLQERYEAAVASARAGDLEDMPADLFVRHYDTWKKIKHDAAAVDDLGDVCGVWIYGPSGCGKSRHVREHYPKHFDKPLNKWFDGWSDRYDGVLLDDVDPTHNWLAQFLNRWADRYAFNAEVKGSTVRVRPEYIVVTSRYTIDQVFATSDSSTRESIARRFPKIIKLGDAAPDTHFTAYTIPYPK